MRHGPRFRIDEAPYIRAPRLTNQRKASRGPNKPPYQRNLLSEHCKLPTLTLQVLAVRKQERWPQIQRE